MKSLNLWLILLTALFYRNRKRDRSASPSPMKANKKNGGGNKKADSWQEPRSVNNALHEDQQRESARARRFGNGSAMGAVNARQDMVSKA